MLQDFPCVHDTYALGMVAYRIVVERSEEAQVVWIRGCCQTPPPNRDVRIPDSLISRLALNRHTTLRSPPHNHTPLLLVTTSVHLQLKHRSPWS